MKNYLQSMRKKLAILLLFCVFFSSFGNTLDVLADVVADYGEQALHSISTRGIYYTDSDGYYTPGNGYYTPGDGYHTPSDGTPTNSVLDQVPNSLKGTQIKMLLWWTPGESDNDKAREFKEATGIEVKYVSAAMDRYQSNLAAMIMGQNSPAIAAITNEWYPLPITRNLMQPIRNSSLDSTIYATNLMDQFGYKGSYYGVSLKTSFNNYHVMFFNKDLLKQKGVKQDPYQLWKAGQWNWDTCLDIAKKCTDAKRGLSGLTMIGLHSWMLSAGEDYVKSTNAGLKINTCSPGVLNAWNWNWDLIYSHKVVDTSYTGQTPFYQGKAAMLGGPAFLMQYDGGHANCVPKNMKDDWGVVPFPSPNGRTYAACEGTVWGFPTRVTGNKLQAAGWYLRYYLDDFNIPEVREDFFDPNHPESWEIMEWMADQKVQSYNSVGVLTYGGEYTAYSIQFSLVDEAYTKAKIKTNLDAWNDVFEANINKITNELGDSSGGGSSGGGGLDAGCWGGYHNYSNDCDANCNSCDATRNAAHVYQNSCDATCNRCGAKRTASHKYDNACDTVCNVCGEVRTITHEYADATCTDPMTCSVCGATNGKALGHSYTPATCTNPKTCSVCGETEGEALGHKSNNGTVTKEATCTTTGTKIYKCLTCGDALKTETIDKTAHTYTPATCTNPKTCSVCGETEGRALGHVYDDRCDTDCNDCGATRSVTHSYNAATCTKAKTCKVCGDTEGRALGHAYDNPCDTMCNTCGAGRAISHAYAPATCTAPKTCLICGDTEGRALGHAYDNPCDAECNDCGAVRPVTHVYLPATCTTPQVCYLCGATGGKALGHKSDKGTVTKKATCTATGTKTHKCSVCDKKLKTEVIAKVAHSYKPVTKKATTTTNGYTVKRCSVCKKETGKTTIYKASKVTLSKTAYTYNGKVQKPGVVVKDSKGKTIAKSNYIITYASGRKNVGTYKVTIKFKGNYSGTKTLTFKINPAKTTVKSLTAGKKSLKVAITKKSTQVSGYEVQYSTSKSFKTYKSKTLTSYKKTSLTLSGLSAKKTYYVRVRTYKTVGGKKYYSGWSTIKYKKTK